MIKRIQRWLTIMVTALMMVFSVSAMASGSDTTTAGESVVKKEVIGFAGADRPSTDAPTGLFGARSHQASTALCELRH